MKFHWVENLKSSWRHDRVWLWLLILTGLMNLGDWALLSRLGGSAGRLEPLHYTIYFGTDLSLGPRRLLIIPALGATILIIHFLTSTGSEQPLWRRTWALTALVLNTLLLAASGALFYVASTSL